MYHRNRNENICYFETLKVIKNLLFIKTKIVKRNRESKYLSIRIIYLFSSKDI